MAEVVVGGGVGEGFAYRKTEHDRSSAGELLAASCAHSCRNLSIRQSKRAGGGGNELKLLPKMLSTG